MYVQMRACIETSMYPTLFKYTFYLRAVLHACAGIFLWFSVSRHRRRERSLDLLIFVCLSFCLSSSFFLSIRSLSCLCRHRQHLAPSVVALLLLSALCSLLLRWHPATATASLSSRVFECKQSLDFDTKRVGSEQGSFCWSPVFFAFFFFQGKRKRRRRRRRRTG